MNSYYGKGHRNERQEQFLIILLYPRVLSSLSKEKASVFLRGDPVLGSSQFPIKTAMAGAHDG